LPKSKNRGRVGLLSCRVSSGMFANEVFIVVEMPDGQTVTSVADKSEISPRRGNSLTSPLKNVEADVQVVVIERVKDKVLVDLPRETFSGGNRLLVPESMIQYRNGAHT